MNAQIAKSSEMTQKKEKIVTTVRMDVELRRRLSRFIEERRYTPQQITVDGFILRAVRNELQRAEGVVELTTVNTGGSTIDAIVSEDKELRALVIEFIRLMRDPLQKDLSFANVVRRILSQRIEEREQEER